MTTVSEIMNPEVVICTPEDRVSEAVEVMATGGLEYLPVCDDSKLVGTITARDILLSGAVGKKGYRLSVKKVMKRRPRSISGEMSAEKALGIMKSQHTRWLPVDEGGRFSGIVTLGEIAQLDGLEQKAAQVFSHIFNPKPASIKHSKWPKAFLPGILIASGVLLFMIKNQSEQ